jgi:hypothetical protein
MLDQEDRKQGDVLLEDRPSDSPAPGGAERDERRRRTASGEEGAAVSGRVASDQPGWKAQVKSWSSPAGETATLTMPTHAGHRQSLIAARVRTTAAPRQPFPPLPEADAREASTPEPAAKAPPASPAADPVAAPPAPAPEPVVAKPEPAPGEVSPYLAAARRAAEAARERAARIRTIAPAPLPHQPLQPAPRPPAPRAPGWMERGVSVQRAAQIAHIGFRPLTGSAREKPYRTEYETVETPPPPAVAAARTVAASRAADAIAREERFRRLAREIEAQQRQLSAAGREEPSTHARPDEGAEPGLLRRWSRRLAGGA